MDKPRPLLDSVNPNINRFDFRSRPLMDELKVKYQVDDFHRLSFNESAYGPSPKVVEALQAAAAGVGNYPEMTDLPLRNALAETLGRGLTPDHFVTGCSGYESLELVTRAFLRPGDEVILTHPTFGIYDRLTQLGGATVRDVPLKQPSFEHDVDGILAAINDQTRAVLICNPNNPTGNIMNQARLDKLVQNLPDHVLLICDEVYHHFVTDPDYPDSIQNVLDGRNVAIIHTFSKGYGLAGMRIGYVISTPDIANYVRKLHRGFHQNALQLAAAISALSDPEHLQKNVDAGVQGRTYLMSEFDRLDLPYIPTQTNFILVELPCPAADVVEKLMYRGILVRAMPDISPRSLRVSVGKPEANEVFIAALESVLQELL